MGRMLYDDGHSDMTGEDALDCPGETQAGGLHYKTASQSSVVAQASSLPDAVMLGETQAGGLHYNTGQSSVVAQASSLPDAVTLGETQAGGLHYNTGQSSVVAQASSLQATAKTRPRENQKMEKSA